MSGRHDDLNREAAEIRGERFTEALLELKRRKGGAQLTSEEQFQAAQWACLNRAERRRARRGK